MCPLGGLAALSWGVGRAARLALGAPSTPRGARSSRPRGGTGNRMVSLGGPCSRRLCPHTWGLKLILGPPRAAAMLPGAGGRADEASVPLDLVQLEPVGVGETEEEQGVSARRTESKHPVWPRRRLTGERGRRPAAPLGSGWVRGDSYHSMPGHLGALRRPSAGEGLLGMWDLEDPCRAGPAPTCSGDTFGDCSCHTQAGTVQAGVAGSQGSTWRRWGRGGTTQVRDPCAQSLRGELGRGCVFCSHARGSVFKAVLPRAPGTTCGPGGPSSWVFPCGSCGAGGSTVGWSVGHGRAFTSLLVRVGSLRLRVQDLVICEEKKS